MTILAEGRREDFDWLVWAIHMIKFSFWSQPHYPQQMDINEPMPVSGPAGRDDVRFMNLWTEQYHW